MDRQDHNNNQEYPRLYTDLAEWFHLLTPPENYLEEAEYYRNVLIENSRLPVSEVLEMGSGGGNNASHLKPYFKLTLTDVSRDMLKISKELNPECEHVQGDMRNLRLGRQFDAVFIHDAISYIIGEEDLVKTMETAFVHCKPGGVVLFTPDFVRETFFSFTKHGGIDKGNRGIRYLEWIRDPDTSDASYVVDFAYLLREDDRVWCEGERHTLGLFSEKDWLRFMESVGFRDVNALYDKTHEPHVTPVFTGIKPE
ncbi:MAG: methyltransferase domain-containing protein [Dehalococcoidales bacterium]|nr:methyltransferase domain-containing protein [Dehalococcoidales bacterium]